MLLKNTHYFTKNQKPKEGKMSFSKFLIFMCLVLALFGLSWGIDQVGAQTVVPTGAAGFNPNVDYQVPNFAYSPNLRKFVDRMPGLGAPGCTVSSPPGTGTCNENNLGQYIPIAVPDKTTYSTLPANPNNPDADYYEISANEYAVQMHSDLKTTTKRLRGYAQTNAAGTPSVQNVNQYLGPLIIAKSYDPTKPPDVNGNGRPVRVKFKNNLPAGVGKTLPLPVDLTQMGSGMGPDGTHNFSQSRVSIPHLHGGATPWISDGTPQQWLTPVGDPTQAYPDPRYHKGDSFRNVPDMVGSPGGTCVAASSSGCIASPAPTDGLATLYWTNQQSARLMFYHDHAYGLTRHNVYLGMAAPFLLIDQVEQDMILGTNVSGAFTPPLTKSVLPNLGGVYTYGIPLVIQDKTFVNDAITPPGAGFPSAGVPTAPTAIVDPRWYSVGVNGIWAAGTTPPVGGALWWPHEYIPNENPYDPSGANPQGRSDYGPWLNPAIIPLNSTLPSPSVVPEAWGDTMVVNGTAFPYLNVPAAPVRFRILNAATDRSLNLQWYVADPATPTEVKMVPAAPNPAFPTWPMDGRNGGVPDPTTQGPSWYQIGNEGGLMPLVAVRPPQPVGIEYSRLVPTLLNVSAQSLLLMGAFRADVVVDFSAFAGKTLILYNDAPAPMPLFDERNDQYTDAPDFRSTGGAPTTMTGFGPNTRTVMQVRVASSPGTPFDLAALQAALPQAYKATQAPPIVPQSAYNAAFNPNPLTQQQYPDTYVNITDESVNVTGTGQGVDKVITVLGGSGYVTPPNVTFVNASPGGAGAAATAYLNGVTAVTVTTQGTGYTSAPLVTIESPTLTATATATVDATGAVSATTLTNGGAGYNALAPPAVTIAAPPCVLGPGCVQATATATVNANGVVTAITLTAVGAGYAIPPALPPTIGIAPPTAGVQATAGAATITGNAITAIAAGTAGSGYFAGNPPVSIAGGGGTGATATAIVDAATGGVTGFTVTNGGSGYTSQPTITMPAPVSYPATAVATVSGGGVTAVTIVDPGAGYRTNPQVTFSGGGGTGAVAISGITLGSVAHIQVTGSPSPSGAGYTKAPFVFFANYPGDTGIGATADSKLVGGLPIGMKNITEGFEPYYGRINILLGTTPVPLDPLAPAPAVPGIATYIDPPSDFWKDGQTYVFRLAHLGVDSHSVHFHLANLQVVNRVDATNTMLPPAPDELGWRESIRTNPFTDVVLAVTPRSQKLPFPLPRSVRLLDPTTPAGSTANYIQPAPVPGLPNPAGGSNLMTDFGFEYVWHCHLLSHEENDMMRTIVFEVPTAIPAAATLAPAANTPSGAVNLSWTYNSGNESGFKVQRCQGPPCTPVTIATVNLNLPTYLDTTVAPGVNYRYQVVVFNSIGDAPASNFVDTGVLPTPATPANPSLFTATASPLSSNPPSVALVWTDNSTNEGGFVIQRATNALFTGAISFPMIPANETAFTDTTVAQATQYWYRVRAVTVTGTGGPVSAWFNAAPFPVLTTGQLPADPANLVASPFTVTTTPPSVTVNLTWTDNSDNETNFRIQRATDASFTAGLTNYTVGANVTSYNDAAVSPNIQYFYRVIALNANGASAPSNTAIVTPAALSLPSPTNLTATASAAGHAPAVSLAWTDNDTNVTTFIIQRAADAGFTVGLASFSIGRLGNVTTYTDKTVAPLTTYFYRVVAFNVLGTSLPSNTATVTTNSGANYLYFPLILKP
jgi:FtsP/CotA-like multicopper oxidase with cupredoxin domain